MRAFFCIPIPPNVQRAVYHISEDLRGRTRMRASWVAERNYHITLHFLGDIDPMLTVDLEEVARRACREIAPFTCTLDRVSAFPRVERARVLWIGGDAPPPFLKLARLLNAGLQTLGFPRTRKEAVAHVTLARIKSQPDPELVEAIAGLDPIAPLALAAKSIVLMESTLTPRGAEYAPLFTTALGGQEE